MSGYARITEDQHAASAAECRVCDSRTTHRQDADGSWLCKTCEADEAPARHTPGPWEISRRKKYKAEISDEAKGWSAFASVYVALDDGLGNPIPSQEGEANARLIAAAPELLIACRAAWAFLSPRRDNAFAMSALEIVEAAIAKAEGRS